MTWEWGTASGLRALTEGFQRLANSPKPANSPEQSKQPLPGRKFCTPPLPAGQHLGPWRRHGSIKTDRKKLSVDAASNTTLFIDSHVLFHLQKPRSSFPQHPFRSQTDVATADAMTEVGHADLSRLLQSKRNECQPSRSPQQSHALSDAPAATSAEWQFLQTNDILQYVLPMHHKLFRLFCDYFRPLVDFLSSAEDAAALQHPLKHPLDRTFDEASIPPRPPQSVEALKRFITAQLAATASPARSPAASTPGTASNSTNSARSTPGVQSPANIQNASKPAITPQLSAAALAARAQNQPNQPADASRRPNQVSFPPGTKGSPSLTPTPTANGTPAHVPTTDGSLSIKLPHDTAKVTDAMSSPGSTAASATTTAAHDISANTSPDNEGPRSPETAQQSTPAAAKPEVTKEANQKQPPSDEDQLLQESIRSAAASGSEDEAPSKPAATPKPQANNNEHSTTEVPDSQDEADKMDVDAPEDVQASINVKPTPPLLTPQATRDSVPVERAVTRVSSGAMRLKSVNEIVGATPRSMDRGTPKDLQDQLTPSASAPESPASRSKSRKDRGKGQMSTVLFGKQPKRVEDKAVATGQKEQFHPFDDYYTPLFIQNFTGATNWMQPIEKILFHANKTIGTSDANLAILDNQACKVLRRVYHLQQHDKWSLRQPKRCPEPTRPSSQWDVMLQEMKWMRTDFREERKWKMTIARNLAYACAEWHESDAEERLALQVVARIPPKVSADGEDTQMGGAEVAGAENHPTPDLEPSGDAPSPLHDDISEVFVETVAPSAIFSLQEDDVVFGLRRTQAADQLLEELPLYGAPLKVPHTDLTNPEFDPDAHWRRPALPLSKYIEGEMNVTTKGPPRKRGRFDYRNEDSDDDGDSTFGADQIVNHARTDATTSNVALFNPESKAIRDRLHAGHQFRPPSEHPMPMQSFYECRSASQWTVAEDDELRGLVREYSYNWSLISSMLSTRSSFVSGPERRTPWECFERWINLEGLPADMQKTQYFKAYNHRIESAQRVIVQQNQIAAQQANAAGSNMPPMRRRPSIPVRVERRRNQKHLTLIDAMRKLAKKRETAQQKQQHTAQQNAVKKAAEPVSQRPSKTPRDYSLLRYERDQALAEKMAQAKQLKWLVPLKARWREDFVVKPNDAHNLQRPETVESLFYMWRITGDVKYREWGWEMFTSFMNYTAVEDQGGFTSLDDANVLPPRVRDNMESFWLAETLKYMYLLFSDNSLMPLDKIVLNTEAHPLPRFDMGELFKTGWQRKPRDADGKIIGKEKPTPVS
ncbi:hypothetical protein NLG97_g4149 [Lecanicillium saksenae]|uniref:Uncharacterized protein n=1 Tax=Lecanicillium saksenae TaxID=468837 RepID=A0ACC1QW35_9HYPO|nr:hypothetical protein NLG97_g4149 [Lecanicillium saksenae]